MKRVDRNWVRVWALVAVAATGTWAVAQNLTVRGVTTGEGDAHFMSNVQISGTLTASNTGSAAVRWGNGTPPSGTVLLYQGLAMNEYHTHPGGGQSLCVAPGDPGPSSAAIDSIHADLLNMAATADAPRLPPGVPAFTLIPCAVFRAPGETFEMWGSDTCPTGSRALYSGISMGQYYNSQGSGDRFCVDTIEFDGSRPRSGTYTALWYGTEIHHQDGVVGYEASTWLKCSVCMLE